MLRNFLITSLRILWRNKVVSTINILSLSIGITAFILILLYVHHETSYDKFNENYDRIYRLEGDEYARVPYIVGELAKDRIPEIEAIVRMPLQQQRTFNFINVSDENPGNSTVIRTHRIFTDSSVFNVFTLPFIKGNPGVALNEPHSVVLTESTAKKLFGKKDPIGEIVAFDHLFRTNNQYKVTGVIRDLDKSHLPIDVLLSYPDSSRLRGLLQPTYLLLAEHSDPELVEEKINDVLSEITHSETTSHEFREFHLRPLRDLYLNGSATKELYGKQGNGKLLWSFMAIAVFVLLLAIINYINLTTARSTLRSKEVILKKVMGSGKGLLRFQFITESILISFIAFLLALTTVQLLIPKFNQLAMVHINISDYNTPIYWILVIAAILLTGILAGFYPALLLTSFRSVAKIPVGSMSGTQGVIFRRLLLTFQFSISVLLIIGILTNLRQLQFARNANPGFDKEQVVFFAVPGQFEKSSIFRNTLKERLLQYPDIAKVASCSQGALGEHTVKGLEIDGAVQYFRRKIIDPDYSDVMGIELIEGRNFSWDRLADKYYSDDGILSDNIRIIVNETAAREYWSGSPIGKICYTQIDGLRVKAEIIGIANDVHYRSMHHKLEPMFFTWSGEIGSQVNLKISSANIAETINAIEKEWKEVYGSEPFEYSFLDEAYEQQYTSDERAAQIIGYFTIIAISIACMGLFALSSFMAVRRTKEIGIRKALGASSKTIFIMLSREYIRWILLSALIASPIAWFAMNKWLESFAYRIELGPGVFIIAAIIALAIGLITVGWQALKSAVANPVEALRYE